jgi:glutathione S-transferase
MLKVWGRRNSINVQKIMWIVDELELEIEHIDAGMDFGVVTEPWFGDINPNRRVPAIDDSGFILWESNVIVRYLASKYSLGSLMPSLIEGRAQVEMWMDWQQTTLMLDLGPLFLGLIRTPAQDRDLEAMDSAARGVEAGLRILDGHLIGKTFIMGDAFTAADVALGCVTYRWYALNIDHAELPNLNAWYERLTERPSFVTNVMMPLT